MNFSIMSEGLKESSNDFGLSNSSFLAASFATRMDDNEQQCVPFHNLFYWALMG